MTSFEKNLLSDPINFEDIEVSQQLYKASSPNFVTFSQRFFLIYFTASFYASLNP